MVLVAIIIDTIKALLALLSITSSPAAAEVEKGMKECTRALRIIHKTLKTSNSLGEKQHLMAQLRQIKSLRQHLKQLQKSGAGITTRKETARDRAHWDDTISAFSGRIRTGVISNLKHKDPKDFLVDCKAIFTRRIQNALKKDNAVKVNTAFGGEFVIAKAQQMKTEMKYFTTANAPIYRNTNIDEWFDAKVTVPITRELEEFQEKDSGWALKQIINLGVNINKFTPQLGSSYIQLPKQIRLKHACVNVKNDDNACFAWAVTSALHPAEKHADRPSAYPHYSSVLNLTGIQFPMSIRQILRFEKQNNLSINVYQLTIREKKFVTLPVFLTKDKKEQHVNLLMIQSSYSADDDDDDIPISYHYVWIKSLSRLLSAQLSKRRATKYFCDRCLHYYYSKERLAAHYEDCKQMNNCKVRMPDEKNKILKFKNYKNKEKAPFIIYADIESILEPIQEKGKYQKHTAAVVGYFMKCSYDDSLSYYTAYRGRDCMEWFAKALQQLAEKLGTVFWCPYDMDTLTSDEQQAFYKATICHICQQPFTESSKKVRDHNHLMSGGGGYREGSNYRGPVHEDCNINYQDTHVVPVVFHNLSGYDANFIIEQIAAAMEGQIDLLPITKEKYISFTKNIQDSPIKFRFIDSYRFMADSLDKLSSYLQEFPNLKREFNNATDEQFSLLTKKGIMPYDYLDSVAKFDESQLPSIEHFYNKLEDKVCPRRLYHRAELVWTKFEIETLGEYVDLYLKTDVLLLADVFEQFRSSCLGSYNLDPAHYFTLPGYTWDCMLKHTNINLELLTDIDMLLFIERGIRGGLSQCSKRYAKANNKYMPHFDSNQESKYMMYFDVNNQYGWAMSQCLPQSDFKWTDSNIDIMSIPDDSSQGYILEVDLEYPEHLHDMHRDLPFCPEHINLKTGKEDKKEKCKLMATLRGKQKYVIHYSNLKQAINQGIKLTKVYRVLQFKQSPWLKGYINLNTLLRTASKNEFEKNLIKLMNNAVFGKTMENIRNHVNVELITNWLGRYGAEALIAKPEFSSCTIFNENLVSIELKKLEIYMNKPIYVGMAILDLAKLTTYSFHYDYMVPKFGVNCTLCYTDTDSLTYEIISHDPYETIKHDCHTRFDTSEYSDNNIYEIPRVNKKVLGLMKDENNGVPMTEFVGLRAKLYTFKTLRDEAILIGEINKLKEEGYENEEIQQYMENYGLTKKAKGVKKSVVKTTITFEDYKNCLDDFIVKSVAQNLIKAEKHHVYSMVQEKIALSPHDDKRYLVPGSYETLPWGHYSIMNVNSF